ncbi:ABC transporter ATP-binding protein [Epilithonimonas ginsengisoli]|uniref:ABC transporter ATP-binding protein n=1 Tax=Epilithonimonas ginsengisoli TaxID=1245592 RepID=A0ABU4JEZ3_9FLAO|nr:MULTISPECIES: ABC transporter ATP-binding protein [Chryseobacterium group]MBV6879527.1 ABC transporter ATP-binding protein [Epilithonimonas sp. FP105]MDW8548163.1 ABC transporter ATP-binding protein [Epilithonimonas ginsengisoli]OAH64402.1 multidrug ABC transporter ATP-binding protein [Chryseobacterium sp. FP211-J200]
MELSIKNISKTYANGLKALDNVNLTIGKGMFGLLGPNGAGKSSLMRTIAGLQAPDSGEIFLGDLNALTQKEELRKVLGYLPQDFGFYPKVNAVELLNHIAILKGNSNKSERKEIVEGLLHQTNLFEARKRNVSEYSGGMRQRFGIAQALLGNPKLIIVDEPTAGLDPMERNRFHNLLSEIGENTIVILSTHIVDDVKNLCNRVVVLTSGHIILDGTPKGVIEDFRGKIWKKLIEKSEVEVAKEQFQVISTHISEGKVEIRVFSETQPDANFIPVESNLEDVYFSSITKKIATNV